MERNVFEANAGAVRKVSLRMVGVVFDITKLKEADQERLDLAGRLINSHWFPRSGRPQIP
jgi:hypothetical protein